MSIYFATYLDYFSKNQNLFGSYSYSSYLCTQNMNSYGKVYYSR